MAKRVKLSDMMLNNYTSQDEKCLARLFDINEKVEPHAKMTIGFLFEFLNVFNSVIVFYKICKNLFYFNENVLFFICADLNFFISCLSLFLYY